MRGLRKNIQLMLEFLKVPILVLHFPYYTLMTFLKIFAIILLSLLMILLSALNVIRHLIYGNNFNSLLNLNLAYERLWNGAGSGLLILMLVKTQLVSFDRSNNTGAIDVKIDGSVLGEKHLLRCWG